MQNIQDKTLGGATPRGTHDEQAAAAAVKEMFDQIAPRYDLLNHLLSLNIDRLWWRRAARTFRDVLIQPRTRILDICCGTGQMALSLLKWRPADAEPLLAADFAHQMLLRASKRLPSTKIILIEADALRLPIADASVDLVTTAFGFRNLTNYQSGLQELHRVLKPGGALGILDFADPDGLMGKLYSIYFHSILPRIGAAVSGVAEAYQYLPESVGRFPAPERMLKGMEDAGFVSTSWTAYNFGVAGLYRGVRS